MPSKTLGDRGYGFEYAARHAAHGWAAFPLMPGTKRPIPGTRGFLDATNDLGRLAARWDAALDQTGEADLGVGFRCNGAAGFTIDLDVKNGKDGVAEFRRLVMAGHASDTFGWDAGPLSQQWPAGWLRYRTRSGGMHIVFRTPPGDPDYGRPVHTGADVLGSGIDTRGPRGYRATYDPSNPRGYVQIGSAPGPATADFGPTDAPAWLLNDSRLYGPDREMHVSVAVLPDGDACPAVRTASDPGRFDFTDHHGCATRVLHLVRLGEEGHTGVIDALAALLPLYVEGRQWKTAQDGQDRDPEGDWFRMVEGAMRKGTGTSGTVDPCTRVAERMRRFVL